MHEEYTFFQYDFLLTLQADRLLSAKQSIVQSFVFLTPQKVSFVSQNPPFFWGGGIYCNICMVVSIQM